MKILHTADIHLREYGDDRWNALQELIEVGKKEKIEIFAISGDLFDKGIDAENLRPKIRGIFSETGFKILIIPGNHDSDSYERGKFFGDDAVVLTDADNPFEDKEVRILGIPFEPIESERILDKFHSVADKLTSNKKNIILYHGELLDAFFYRKDFGDEGIDRYMPVKLSYFKDLNVHYILAGHFHSDFKSWTLGDGQFFVYPGSPISITKREIGKRKVNLFEVGKPPKEYPINTPHFEEVIIELDPFKDEKPIAAIKKRLEGLHPKARVILTVKGFVDSELIRMDEAELKRQIKETTAGRCDELNYECSDVKMILKDDLFKSFINKLEQTNYSDEKRKQMCDFAIKAMIQAKQSD